MVLIVDGLSLFRLAGRFESAQPELSAEAALWTFGFHLSAFFFVFYGVKMSTMLSPNKDDVNVNDDCLMLLLKKLRLHAEVVMVVASTHGADGSMA